MLIKYFDDNLICQNHFPKLSTLTTTNFVKNIFLCYLTFSSVADIVNEQLTQLDLVINLIRNILTYINEHLLSLHSRLISFPIPTMQHTITCSLMTNIFLPYMICFPRDQRPFGVESTLADHGSQIL